MNRKRKLLKNLGWSEELLDAFVIHEPNIPVTAQESLEVEFKTTDRSNIKMHADQPLISGDAILR